MINIVHAFFGNDGLPRNTKRCIGAVQLALVVALLPVLLAVTAEAAPPAGGFPAGGEMSLVAGAVVRCDPYRNPYSTDCPGHRPPGPPDRDVRPFDGTLGRPCAYRWRFTPSGTRRVRVCF